MRKVFLAFALIASLGGCAQLSALRDVVSIGTTSVTNPVTKDRLYQLESAVTLVFAGLNTWKASCVNGLINANCKEQIAQVQVYTREIPPYLIKLRVFVKNNDQVNAVVVFNNLSSLISTVKARAAANNIALGN